MEEYEGYTDKNIILQCLKEHKKREIERSGGIYIPDDVVEPFFKPAAEEAGVMEKAKTITRKARVRDIEVGAVKRMGGLDISFIESFTYCMVKYINNVIEVIADLEDPTWFHGEGFRWHESWLDFDYLNKPAKLTKGPGILHRREYSMFHTSVIKHSLVDWNKALGINKTEIAKLEDTIAEPRKKIAEDDNIQASELADAIAFGNRLFRRTAFRVQGSYYYNNKSFPRTIDEEVMADTYEEATEKIGNKYPNVTLIKI